MSDEDKSAFADAEADMIVSCPDMVTAVVVAVDSSHWRAEAMASLDSPQQVALKAGGGVGSAGFAA